MYTMYSLRYLSLAINYGLCCVAVLLLCFILSYDRLDQFQMQAALAALFLMLLQAFETLWYQYECRIHLDMNIYV